MTVSAYADEFGVKQNTVSGWIIAQRVKGKCIEDSTHFNLSVDASFKIGTLKEDDWVWVAELSMDKKLGSDAREKVIKVIKELRNNNRDNIESIITQCFANNTLSIRCV